MIIDAVLFPLLCDLARLFGTQSRGWFREPSFCRRLLVSKLRQTVHTHGNNGVDGGDVANILTNGGGILIDDSENDMV